MAAHDIHPICKLLPEMTPAEYESLRKDVEKNGLLHPIVLYDGLILDGRHRYRACLDTGTEPRFETYTGNDPAGLVWSENGTRRNLSTSQRALVAASFLEYEKERAMKRKAANGGDRKSECKNFDTPISDTGRATAKAGAKFGISGEYVFRAAKVLEKAEPEVINKIRSGTMTVNEAQNIIDLRPEAQRRIADIQDKSQRKRATQEANIRSESCRRREVKDRPVVDHPGTPFLRKWLNAMERIAITLAEVDIRQSAEIVQRFEEDMDWESDVLAAQFERCDEVIEAMHKIHIKHGKKSKPKLSIVNGGK